MRTALVIALAVALLTAGAAVAGAGGDMAVMAVFDLDRRGEDARILPVEEFEKNRKDYEDFQELLAKAPTLKDLAAFGWRVVYVEPRPDYYLMILER